MRTTMLAVFIVLFAGQSRIADAADERFVDASKLHEWFEADTRITREHDTDPHDLINDSRTAGEFLGFMMGVTDAMDGKAFCLTPATGLKQLRTILIQWMILHPEKDKMRGLDIVTTAFAESFPCPSK